ncbi:acetate--CoA ligase family protein [Actinophytocola sp.]|uniref:acetate--CoA ligase family protein n=1 Tax=Actinophytocola sp. TaxID=1872138 RepID=UPI003D6BAF08
MSINGADLVRLLAAPSCVAVVGASDDSRKPAARPISYLRRHGFRGRVVPVSSRRAEVGGVPAVRSLTELPHGSVDVAMIVLPASLVPAALEDAAAAGVAAAVVISSGFEVHTGDNRRRLDEAVDPARTRVIGPNCVGTLAVRTAAYLTFSSVLLDAAPQPGRVGLVTQSGALGNSLLQTLMHRHVGISQWISTGNEADVGALELVTGLLGQPDIDAVGLFLEGITDRRWLPALENALRDTGKQLFVLKAANSTAGRQAAAGHTGRVVGSAQVARAILAEIGAYEVPDLGALADALAVNDIRRQLPLYTTPRVCVVSVSGAAAVIAADRINQHPQLQLATVDSSDTGLLAGRLDPRLAPTNPVDVPFLDETGVFVDTIDSYAVPEISDLVVAIESGLAHDRAILASRLADGDAKVPVVLTSLSEADPVGEPAAATLAAAGVAYLPTVERAVDALSLRPGAVPATSVEPDGHAHGLEWVAARMPADFPLASWRLVADEHAARLAGDDLGFPLVMKAAGRTIEHRSELGAVRVVRDSAALGEAFAAIRAVCDAHGDAVVAQRWAPGGFELMVSAIRDPEFGPVALVRPGGVLAEHLVGQAALWGGWDARRRLAVLRHSTIGELLDGYRGGPVYDVEALNELVSTALHAVDTELSFLEINPTIVGESGVVVVDALARP